MNKTEFAHAVNFTMSFGVTVLPEEINKIKERLHGENGDKYHYSSFNIKLTKNSTDEEIANYIGLENYKDWMLSECVEMEMEDHHVYNKKDTERLIKEYQEKLEDFKKRNKCE
jgi:hypothetical protein